MKPRPGMCTRCGSMNAIGLTKCGSCGADIPVPVPVLEVREDEKRPRKCKWCGNTVREGEEVCVDCRERQSDTRMRAPTFKKKTKPSRALALGGAFLIFSGFAAFGWGLLLLFLESLIFELSGYGTGIGTCGVVMMLLGAGSLAGGILAMWRSYPALVLVGSICSFLCVTLFVGSILGLMGMVVIGVPLGLIGPWLITSTRAEFD